MAEDTRLFWVWLRDNRISCPLEAKRLKTLYPNDWSEIIAFRIFRFLNGITFAESDNIDMLCSRLKLTKAQRNIMYEMIK